MAAEPNINRQISSVFNRVTNYVLSRASDKYIETIANRILMGEVSFGQAVAVGLGGIIGAGIFVLSGTMIRLSGNGALLAFVITGAVAVIVALEMGELTSSMPGKTGASYSFVYEAFGSELGFVTGILLYLSFTASISAIALGFGAYLASMLGFTFGFSKYVFAVLLILSLIVLNLKGVSEAARADTFIVMFKLAVLVIFIVFALFFGKYLAFNLRAPPAGNVGGIFAASVIAMFAYAGFQSIATMAPNIKGGGKTAAKAILVAVSVSLVFYVAVTVALLSLAPSGSFKFSADPLSFALRSAGASLWLFELVDVAALAATTSATLSMLIAGTELMSQLSRDGLLPTFLGKDRRASALPSSSLLITAAFGTGILFAGNIYTIAAISNFGVLFSYLISGFALVKVRRMRRHPERHREDMESGGIVGRPDFRMPLYPFLPVAGTVLIISFFFGFPGVALSAGVSIVLVSLILYYALREDRDESVIKIKFFR